MTTIEALQTLYVALGGDATDVANINTIPPMIAAIATAVEEHSGGGDLPSVTAENNGQVLSVVDGAWAAANAPTELPAVTADDNGDVLTVVEGAWAAATPAP